MRETIIRLVPLILCAHEELHIVEFLMRRIWVFSHRADELQLCTLCTCFPIHEADRKINIIYDFSSDPVIYN